MKRRSQELASLESGEPSGAIGERVIQARSIQRDRFSRSRKVHCNADMGSKGTQKHCVLAPEAQDLLKMAISDLNFSARAYGSSRSPRTIADLAGADTIQPQHISEAIQYRSLDRQIWT